MAQPSCRFAQVVAFDLDQCLVAAHSHGRMTPENLPDFTARVSPDFVAAVPALAQEGFCLAVATHSDRVEYSCPGRSRGTHLLGEDLVRVCPSCDESPERELLTILMTSAESSAYGAC